MTRTATLVLLVGSTLIACTPKSTHQAVLDQLGTCTDDLASARDQTQVWEDRFAHWETQFGQRLLDQESATAVNLDTIQLKFAEIRTAVPEVIQTEVGDHIDDVERLLVAGFRDLSEGNRALQAQLDETRQALDAARQDLQTGNELARTAQTERHQISDQISDLTNQYGKLIGQIHEFDRTRLQCKSCDEYLDLRKRKAGDVAAFHNDLVRQLNTLQKAFVAQSGQAAEAGS